MSISYDTLVHFYTCWAQPIDQPDYTTMTDTNTKASAELAGIEICDEPYQGRYHPSKYDALFDRLRPGQRLKCPSGQAQKIGNSLKKFLQKRLIEGLVVRHMERCPDGHGGVWMLFKEPAAAAEYERRKQAAIKTELRPVPAAIKPQAKAAGK